MKLCAWILRTIRAHCDSGMWFGIHLSRCYELQGRFPGYTDLSLSYRSKSGARRLQWLGWKV